MNELFEQRNILYNLRSQTDFTAGTISTVNNDLKSLRYLGPKSWNIIPPDIRNSRNIEEFTWKIKCLTPKNCPCRLCLNYTHHVEHINKPYFWNKPFRCALANRKSTYFGRPCDGCFCIILDCLFLCFLSICF